jgi:hypothetical protein
MHQYGECLCRTLLFKSKVPLYYYYSCFYIILHMNKFTYIPHHKQNYWIILILRFLLYMNQVSKTKQSCFTQKAVTSKFRFQFAVKTSELRERS